jgi:hypothetical protein
MLIRNDLTSSFLNPRRKLLPLCLLAMIAAGAPAHSADSLNPTPEHIPAFIDPNGLEVDGAGAIDSAIEPETTDLTLLIICITLALAAMSIAVVDQHRNKQAVKKPEEADARPVTSARSRSGA